MEDLDSKYERISFHVTFVNGDFAFGSLVTCAHTQDFVEMESVFICISTWSRVS